MKVTTVRILGKAQKSFQMLDSPTLTLASAELASMNQEFMYFGANVQST